MEPDVVHHWQKRWCLGVDFGGSAIILASATHHRRQEAFDGPNLAYQTSIYRCAACPALGRRMRCLCTRIFGMQGLAPPKLHFIGGASPMEARWPPQNNIQQTEHGLGDPGTKKHPEWWGASCPTFLEATINGLRLPGPFGMSLRGCSHPGLYLQRPSA